MKIYNRRAFQGLFLFMLGISAFSCKKSFDILPEDALDHSQAYQNIFDADAAVVGLYGKLTRVADKYMVLNELRGDLEDVTENSDIYLREVNDHNVTSGNPWANPRPYYDIVINCNDVLKNFDIMLANKRLSQTDYDIRYSEVGALRTWLYLQLGIHYGNIPYITDPLESIEDAQDQSKYSKVTFDELIAKLVAFTESLPTKERIPAGNSLLNPIDGYPTAKIFINKELLMADLYLWQGNYPMASKFYRKLLNYNGGDPIANNDSYAWNTLGANGSDLATSGSSWMKIFAQSYNERVSNNEIINYIPFDRNFTPYNPFISLFAQTTYKIKPSAKAIQNWNEQTRSDGSPIDNTRGINGNDPKSYGNSFRPYIHKLIPNYNPNAQFNVNGKWIISRAGSLHLRFAESANRDGRDSLAYAFFNRGIRTTYTARINPQPGTSTYHMQSYDTNPDYYFDARQGDFPNYRRLWSYAPGVRGRAGLNEVKVDSALYFDMTNPGDEHKPFLAGAEPAFRNALEELLIKEAALELAFEGYRWPDLIRIALRREKETPGTGKAYLKATVAAKFIAAGKSVPAGVNKLGDDVKNWYLPFNF